MRVLLSEYQFNRFVLAYAFFISILASITLIFFSDNIFLPDSASYLNPAKAILETGSFSKSIENQEPMFFRTPGYPLFVASILSYVSLEFVIVFQTVLFGLSSLLVYRIAMVWSGSVFLARAALLISLFDFARIYFSQVLLSETLFVFILWLSIYYLSRYMKLKGLINFYFFSLLMALATLIRPITIYLLPLLPLIPFMLNSNISRKKQLFVAFVSISIIAIIVGSWCYRNYLHTGVFDVASNKGDNGYFYKAASIRAHLENRNFVDVKNEMQADWLYEIENNATIKHMNEMEKSKLLTERAVKLILDKPFLFLSIQIKGAIMLLLDSGASNFAVLYNLHEPGSGLLGNFTSLALLDFLKTLLIDHFAIFFFAFFGLFYLLPLYFFFLRGVMVCIHKCCYKSYSMELVVLAVIAIYMLYFSLGVESFSRLRIPIMLVFYIVAAYGIVEKVSRQKVLEK